MMMFWPGTHRRFRESLSAYIDGEVEASAAGRLGGGPPAPQAASDRSTESASPPDSAAAPSAEGAQTPATGEAPGGDVLPPVRNGGGGSGIDALAAAEIALGVTLGLLLLGGLALTFTGRKT